MLRKFLCALLFLLVPLTAVAQSQCSVGNQFGAIPCAQVAAPVGASVKQVGLTGSMTSQTLCTATTCPAGLYVVHGYVLVTTASLLGAAQVSLSYTDDVSATTQTAGPSISLAGVTRVAFESTVELTGASGITATVAATGLSGTPAYNVYLTAVQLVAF